MTTLTRRLDNLHRRVGGKTVIVKTPYPSLKKKLEAKGYILLGIDGDGISKPPVYHLAGPESALNDREKTGVIGLKPMRRGEKHNFKKEVIQL